MKIPNEITDLMSFLEKQGFTLGRKEGPDPRSFGNMLMEYGNGRVKVLITLDRSCWLLDMADMAQPENWYDAEILRDFVLGVGPDKLSVADQVRVVETAWQDVMGAFSPSRRDATHARLKQLEHERGMRILPKWCRPKEGTDC